MVRDGVIVQPDPDGIVGYVLAKDLAAMVWEKELIVLADLGRPLAALPRIGTERLLVLVVREEPQRRAERGGIVVERRRATRPEGEHTE